MAVLRAARHGRPRPAARAAGTRPGVRTSTVDMSIQAADWYAQSWLPMPYPASKVSVDGRWRFEPEGRTVVGDRRQTTRGVRYRVSSLLVQPTASQLADAPHRPRTCCASTPRCPTRCPPSCPTRPGA
ncbi:transglutaminaseTgpA domain-containing protein [Streptomyces sp. M19]